MVECTIIPFAQPTYLPTQQMVACLPTRRYATQLRIVHCECHNLGSQLCNTISPHDDLWYPATQGNSDCHVRLP